VDAFPECKSVGIQIPSLPLIRIPIYIEVVDLVWLVEIHDDLSISTRLGGYDIKAIDTTPNMLLILQLALTPP